MLFLALLVRGYREWQVVKTLEITFQEMVGRFPSPKSPLLGHFPGDREIGKISAQGLSLPPPGLGWKIRLRNLGGKFFGKIFGQISSERIRERACLIVLSLIGADFRNILFRKNWWRDLSLINPIWEKMKRQTFNLNFLKLQIPQPFQRHSRNGSVTPHRPVKFPIICAANRLGSSEEDLLPPGGIHVKSPSLAPDPICNQLARELLLLMMCPNQQQQQQRKIQNISSITRTSPRVFIKGRGTLCSGPHSIVGSRFFSLLYFPLIRFLFWPFFGNTEANGNTFIQNTISLHSWVSSSITNIPSKKKTFFLFDFVGRNFHGFLPLSFVPQELLTVFCCTMTPSSKVLLGASVLL